jgi:hypothetical protein
MCFSVESSFAAGAVLSAAGIIAMALTKEKKQLFFASIPFIFSIQQFSEGFLWLSFDGSDHINWMDPAKYTYLFFAQVLWPVWIPFAVYHFEKDPIRKKAIRLALYIGIMLATYHAFCLLTYPSDVSLFNNHLQYSIGRPYPYGFFNTYITGILYFIPTVLSLLMGGDKLVRLLGLIILLSYLVTWLLFHAHVISIWCFFSAIISLMIVFIINEARKRTVVKPEI